LLHKYLKLLRGKDRQLQALIDQTLYNKAFNRLTQVIVKNAANTITRRVNFTYDALNRRMEKKVDPDGSGPNPATIERFVYDRDHIKLVFNGKNQLTRRYLHGPTIDQVLAEEISAQVYWALAEHQTS
jgi:hypothetical protein